MDGVGQFLCEVETDLGVIVHVNKLLFVFLLLIYILLV